MPKKIILFNGPPGSGKDTAALAVSDKLGIPHIKLSWPLKYIASDTLGISHEILEQNKERPTVNELSYRQIQIEIFRAIAAVLGTKWLASMVVTRIDRNSLHDVFVLSDCGRPEEVDTLCSAFGAENVLLVGIHRKGKDYSNDIRTQVRPIPKQPYKSIYNDTDIETFKQRAVVAVGEFLELTDD